MLKNIVNLFSKYKIKKLAMKNYFYDLKKELFCLLV
jgi:hypothetical protein